MRKVFVEFRVCSLAVVACVFALAFACFALNPLSRHDALNHHLTTLKTDLISYNKGF